MVALPADIAAATRAATIVIVEDTGILSRFPTARDQKKTAAAGYCDSADDTETALNARAALIAAQGRRRFAVVLSGVVLPDLSGAYPTYRLIDAEQDVDAPMLIGRIALDLEEETTRLELFG